MSIETALLSLAVLLAAGLTATVVALARRRPAAPPQPDPSLALIQQQLTSLAGEVSRVTAQVPREVTAALNQVAGQVGQRLAENAQSVQKASADTGKLIADINLRLGDLGRTAQQILELGPDIRGLQQIFQAPKFRGGLGEMSLESLLRQIFPSEHISLQHAFSNGETVDAVVRLPGGMVPIDSKFPLASFRAMLEAPGDSERQKARRAFARDVRKHVDDIAGKYIRPAEGTLDFALMYIPAENVYYEMIVHDEPGAGDEEINAYALRRRVTPVSPNTLYAHLKAIAFGLMGLRLEDRAREMLKRLQQLHGDFTLFQDAFALGQKHLRNAQAAFSEAGERVSGLASQVDQFTQVTDEAAQARVLPPPTVSH